MTCSAIACHEEIGDTAVYCAVHLLRLLPATRALLNKTFRPGRPPSKRFVWAVGRKVPMISPHRQVLIWAKGPPTDPLHQACHCCPEGENDLCCNPAHLYWGTKGQNEADKERYVA